MLIVLIKLHFTMQTPTHGRMQAGRPSSYDAAVRSAGELGDSVLRFQFTPIHRQVTCDPTHFKTKC